jgi:hypothetical protein
VDACSTVAVFTILGMFFLLWKVKQGMRKVSQTASAALRHPVTGRMAAGVARGFLQQLFP